MCEAKAARVTILRDRTTAAFAAESDNKLTVWWCIFEVTFGHLSDRDEPLQRSGLNKVRICVYHVNNFAARRRPEIVRGHLAAMALDVCQLQADIVAGDANGAAYSFYKRQRNSSLRYSSAKSSYFRRSLPDILISSSLAPAIPAYLKVAALAATNRKRLGFSDACPTLSFYPTTLTKI